MSCAPRGSESRAGRKVWVYGAASEAGSRGAPGEHVWRLAHVGASLPSLARVARSRALLLCVPRLPFARLRAPTDPFLRA